MIGQKQRQIILNRLRKLNIYIECLEETKKDTEKRINKLEEFLKNDKQKRKIKSNEYNKYV